MPDESEPQQVSQYTSPPAPYFGSGGASLAEKSMDSEAIIKRFVQICYEGIEGTDWTWNTNGCYVLDETTGKRYMAFPENAKREYFDKDWKPLIIDKRVISYVTTFILFHVNPQTGNSNPKNPDQETLNIMLDFISDFALKLYKREIDLSYPMFSYIIGLVDWLVYDARSGAFNGPNSLSNKEVATRTNSITEMRSVPMPPQKPTQDGGFSLVPRRN